MMETKTNEHSSLNIDRRSFLSGVAAAGAVSVLSGISPTKASASMSTMPTKPYYKYMTAPATIFDFRLTPQQEERAKELHEKIIIFDSLMECSWYPGFLEQVKRGGGTAGSFSIGNAGLSRWQGRTKDFLTEPEDWWTAETAFKDIAFVAKKARKHADEMMLCLTAADIRKAKAENKIGFMLDIQNANFLGNQPENLEHFYNLGIRRVQLTYNRQNFAGSGCMEANDYGLSIWGKELVERMNSLNMLVDTAHCKPQTLSDAIDVSSKPIGCTHAGMSSRVNNPRSHPDKVLKKLADKGGVFGLVSTPGAINETATCTVKEYVDTIDAAVNLLGVDHVGFGTDLIMAASLEEILSAPEWGQKAAEASGVQGDTVWPWSDEHKGMENNSGYPNLTRGLIAKGYKDEDIPKILGGNFVRLYEEVIGQ